MTTRGMEVICKVLADDPRSRVFWDRSLENLKACTEGAKAFLDIPGGVAFLDGDKIQSRNPLDHIDQNRDYNGWKHDVYRNFLLLWNTYGKIVDAVVNTPGNFHDSKNALWGGGACDSAFYTRGGLEGRLVKSKDHKKGEEKSGYDEQLTALRQSSEWGNNVLPLTGVYRRLTVELPTENVSRACVMWSCIFLTNWRTSTCDRNQIRTYFDYIAQQED
eukprot:scaffold26270_cov60-Attheya_sp.AAC.2